ncbi:MAG: DNA polymerase III subunit chi [Alphaproteobacteria bacterium]|nr:DNA polymerase III subunit chi [Alphaproteobacteria bacterium]
MSRIDFYHLQRQPLEEVLPKLLEKAYSTGQKVLVRIGNEELVEFINSHLWTYNDQSFLPHGSKKDGNSEIQPIWLTSGTDNPNQAQLLFLVDNADISMEELDNYARVFNIFDGHSEDALDHARSLWKEIKKTTHQCHYWKQDDQGKWQEA